MSEDSSYIIGRINSIEFALQNLALVIDSTINTQGRCRAVIDNIYSETIKLKQDYLKSILKLKTTQTSQLSINKLNNVFKDTILTSIILHKELEEHILHGSLYRNELTLSFSKETFSVNKVENGEILSYKGLYREHLSESSLISIFDKVESVNSREQFSKLHRLLNEESFDLVQETFNEKIGSKLNCKYSVGPEKQTVRIDLPNYEYMEIPLTTLRHTAAQNLNLPFWIYINILEDIKTIESFLKPVEEQE